MIPLYEEFIFIESLKNDDSFFILNEKNLTSEIDDSIKFGIVMPTYKMKTDGDVHTGRAKYITSIDVLTDSINSIKNQSYKNWKLYLVGDAYEDDQEVKDLLSSLLKPEQYKYYNLPKPGERTQNITSEEKWMTGGISAMNKGLDLCQSDGIKYIARLDHDDKWKSNHLELLAKAYTQIPNLGFVFTQGRKNPDTAASSKRYFMMPDAKPSLEVNNKGYVNGSSAHSSVSWCPAVIGKFRYRDANQQKNTNPKNTKTKAGDIDMFSRMMSHLKDNDINYMYIPQTTTYVRNRKGKF